MLIVGKVGVGKSTFANFCAGSHIVQQEVDKKNVLEVAQASHRPVAIIGYGKKAQTLSSQVLRVPRLHADAYYVFMDCPGLYDPHNENNSIWFPLAIRKCIQSKTEVKHSFV